MPRPVVSSTTPLTRLLDPQTGLVSREWIKWFQGVQQTVNEGFDQNGVYQGVIGASASFSWRTATIFHILQYLDDSGVMTALGIDFARAYLNKDTDHIADGTGSPLAGGKVAYTALVTSGPAAGQILVFDGAHWQPHAKATTKAPLPHEWIDGYDDATGVFSASQPAFSDMIGAITSAQMPVGGYTGTIVTAALTVGGTQGSMTFDSGQLVAQVPAT
jgi:hypothetical protein